MSNKWILVQRIFHCSGLLFCSNSQLTFNICKIKMCVFRHQQLQSCANFERAELYGGEWSSVVFQSSYFRRSRPKLKREIKFCCTGCFSKISSRQLYSRARPPAIGSILAAPDLTRRFTYFQKLQFTSDSATTDQCYFPVI